MPKSYVVSGGVGPYTWTYSGPWSTNVNGLSNVNFNITNFNGNHNPGTITASGKCESLSKTIRFFDSDVQAAIAVWPNPVSVMLNITPNWTDASAGAVVVTITSDQAGTQVFEEVYSDGAPESLDVSGLQAGIYILYMQKGEEILHTQFEKQ